MAYSGVTGTKAIGDFLSNRLKYDLDQAQVFEPAKDEVQWLSFLMKLGRKPTKSVQFQAFSNDPQWVTHRFYARAAGSWSSNAIANLAVAANKTGTATDVGYLVPGMLIRFRHQASATDTVAVVTNVDTQQQVDIRSIGTNETNVADGDGVQVIGHAVGETSSAGTAAASKLSILQYYCEDFEDTWSMSDVAEGEDVFGPNEWNRLAAETLRIHKVKINRAMLLGQGASTNITLAGIDSGAQTVRTTEGAITFCEDNASSLMDSRGVQLPSYASYTYDEFVDDMSYLFAYQPKGKIMVCGAGPLAHFQKLNSNAFLAAAQVTVNPDADFFGIKVTSLHTTFGDLILVWDKTLAGDGFYRDYAVAIDMDMVKYRPFISGGVSLDTHLMTNLQNPNQPRVRKFGYRTVTGLEIAESRNHGLWKFS